MPVSKRVEKVGELLCAMYPAQCLAQSRLTKNIYDFLPLLITVIPQGKPPRAFPDSLSNCIYPTQENHKIDSDPMGYAWSHGISVSGIVNR